MPEGETAPEKLKSRPHVYRVGTKRASVVKNIIENFPSETGKEGKLQTMRRTALKERKNAEGVE